MATRLPGQQADVIEPDPRYVAARRVLLDALETLTAHRAAIIVAGAQAVYLRTGPTDIGIAPYTIDGDLALDPRLLGGEPALEVAMRDAGFHLLEPLPGRPEPGTWVATTVVAGEDLVISIDLIVPNAAASGGGRRGARLGSHGNRAARRAVGLEAALIDRSSMPIAALEAADSRSFEVDVAGPAALLVAKAHKIHDRLGERRPGRLEDKDATDVYRIMQTTSPTEVGARLGELRHDHMAGPATEAAIAYLAELFGRRGGDGIRMATRALRLAVPEAQVSALATSYIAAAQAALAAPD